MELQTIPNQDLKRICYFYSLGTPVSIRELSGGDINFNYLIETDKGRYVQRVLGSKLTNEKRRLMELEFRVLEKLKKQDFPYHLPFPVINQKGLIIDEKTEKPYWVYPFLEGSKDGMKKADIREIAKVLAMYHNYVSQVELPHRSQESFFNPNWLRQKYEEMEGLATKSEMDKKMKSHLGFFREVFKRVSKIPYTGNELPTHGDFSKANLLFDEEGIVTGIIDFDDIMVAPRIRDVANSVLYSCYNGDTFSLSSYQKFLESYEKNIRLTEEERKLIVPAMLREFCSIFSWFYDSNKKQSQDSFKGMDETYKKAKDLEEKL